MRPDSRDRADSRWFRIGRAVGIWAVQAALKGSIMSFIPALHLGSRIHAGPRSTPNRNPTPPGRVQYTPAPGTYTYWTFRPSMFGRFVGFRPFWDCMSVSYRPRRGIKPTYRFRRVWSQYQTQQGVGIDIQTQQGFGSVCRFQNVVCTSWVY